MTEWRKCEDCGKQYELPLPYAQANPLIRNKCVDCISIYQRENDMKLKPRAGEWFL
jgi:hypothetical protein